MHHILFAPIIPNLIERSKHLRELETKVRDRHILNIRVERDLVVATKGDFVDIAPHFDPIAPGERIAASQNGLAGRGLEGGADDGAAVPGGVDEGDGLVAGTDIGPSIATVGLLRGWGSQ